MNTKSHFTKIAHHQTLIHVIHIYEFESRSGKVYSIQHYVIKFVSDLWQVGGFVQVLGFPQPIKLTTTVLLKYY